ncbi:MAG: Spx/MgsR family RNA polymerase-binding regulatory protein [bacterium]
MIEIYCIPNCDTCKKARKWLDSHAIDYQLIDVKKQPPDLQTLSQWLQQVDEKILLNRRGLTWRKLSEEDKSRPVVELLAENPTMIKRPVMVDGDKITVGFKEATYQDYFNV